MFVTVSICFFVGALLEDNREERIFCIAMGTLHNTEWGLSDQNTITNIPHENNYLPKSTHISINRRTPQSTISLTGGDSAETSPWREPLFYPTASDITPLRIGMFSLS